MTVSDVAAHANARAVQLMRQGRISEAAVVLDEALHAEPENLSLWLNLAAARRAQGDPRLALDAVDRALALRPRDFMALLMKASLVERLGDSRAAGIGYGLAIIQAPPEDSLDEATSRALAHGREVHASYVSGSRAAMLEAARQSGNAGRSPEAGRIATFIEYLVGGRRLFHQQPTAFYWPGLPTMEFYPREEFRWLETVEAATADVRADLSAAMAERAADLRPYVSYPPGMPLDQWSELNNSARWSAYYLYRDGEPVADAARLCATTMATLEGVDQPRMSQRSPAAMFSVLQPTTRIPPHTGVSNTRLVVHLPLVVPEGCGFRVGNETRVWHEGEAWVFDDTIEHEAWNQSGLPRTILIFDVWSPFISLPEREVIAAVTAALDAFNGFAPTTDL